MFFYARSLTNYKRSYITYILYNKRSCTPNITKTNCNVRWVLIKTIDWRMDTLVHKCDYIQLFRKRGDWGKSDFYKDLLPCNHGGYLVYGICTVCFSFFTITSVYKFDFLVSLGVVYFHPYKNVCTVTMNFWTIEQSSLMLATMMFKFCFFVGVGF